MLLGVLEKVPWRQESCWYSVLELLHAELPSVELDFFALPRVREEEFEFAVVLRWIVSVVFRKKTPGTGEVLVNNIIMGLLPIFSGKFDAEVAVVRQVQWWTGGQPEVYNGVESQRHKCCDVPISSLVI
jgi:hypothetical protein